MKATGNPRIDNGTEEVIVGSDECGYGCMAGPLVVAAAAVFRNWSDRRVRDSKKMSEGRREAVVAEYQATACVKMCVVSPADIDAIGVYQALQNAHKSALQQVLDVHEGTVPLVVVDGNLPVSSFGLTSRDQTGAIVEPPIIALPKADDLVPACSLASVFAKVARDALMVEYDKRYPGYGFSKHKGYVTAEHTRALDKLGVCDIHRKSYAPVARLLELGGSRHLEKMEHVRIDREAEYQTLMDQLEAEGAFD